MRKNISKIKGKIKILINYAKNFILVIRCLIFVATGWESLMGTKKKQEYKRISDN